jgi:Pyridoxamine 5'-phosphate oxidase
MIDRSTTSSTTEDVPMPDPVNLTGEIAAAIDGAALRGHTLAVAYVRDDGSPSVSFRGSTYVHSPTQLAIWARKRDSGLAAALVDRPRVSLVFFEMDGPGARYLGIEGHARVVPELDQAVYDAIIEPERQQDPERQGVAVVIDVDSVAGAGENGFFQQARG